MSEKKQDKEYFEREYGYKPISERKKKYIKFEKAITSRWPLIFFVSMLSFYVLFAIFHDERYHEEPLYQEHQ